MKRIKLLFTLLFLAHTWLMADATFAQTYHYQTSFQEAKEKALATKKPLMLFFVTTSCPWCKKLENQTLSKEAIDTFIQTHFIPVILNKDTDAFPKFLNPVVTPTIFFLDAKADKPYYDIIGYKSAAEFSELMQEANTLFKKAQK